MKQETSLNSTTNNCPICGLPVTEKDILINYVEGIMLLAMTYLKPLRAFTAEESEKRIAAKFGAKA